MKIYLGHWEWWTDGLGRSFWRAPGGDALGSIDLRALPGMAAFGGDPDGYAVFVYPQPKTHPLLLVDLGGGVGDSIAAGKRGSLAALLGRPVRSASVREFIADQLLLEGDPTGLERHRPLRGSLRRGVEIHLGGFGRILADRFDESHPAHANTIAVFRADYRRHKSANAPAALLEKFTGAEIVKLFGRFGDELAAQILPPEHAGDRWRRPETTITESFDTADSDTLGPDLSWTELSNDIDVVSNKAQAMTASGFHEARADSDLSSDDHYAQAVVRYDVAAAYPGVLCRKDSSATMTYYLASRILSSGPDNPIAKYIAGSETKLGGTISAHSSGTDYTVKGTCEGSLITCIINTVEQTNATDTSITGNLRCGLMCWQNSANSSKWNDFEAGDLGGAAQSPVPLIMQQLDQFGGGVPL